MHIVGDFPQFDGARTFLRIDGTDSCIACDPVTQNLNGIRVKIELDPTEFSKLIGESDTFASLVLAAVPSDINRS